MLRSDTAPTSEPAARQAPRASKKDNYAKMVDEARALAPLLTKYADETERLGRVADPVIEALHESGLFRIVQPSRVGGYALPATIYFDVCAELARICPSTSWVVGNLAGHHLLLALWSRRAQDEIWGESPDTLIGSSYVFGAGRAKRVEGGYQLSGKWPFSSGIHPCEWVILGALVESEDDLVPPEQRFFLLKKEQYEILDTWNVVGLKGTGSADVLVPGCFVPDHLTLSYADAVSGKAPGLRDNPEAIFRFPSVVAGGFTLVSVLYGAALGALEHFVETTKSRVATASGTSMGHHTTVQMKVAEASACLDMVEMTARHHLETVMTIVGGGEAVPEHMAVGIRRDISFCSQLCVRAVDLVYATAGGSANYKKSPLQRAWRDVHAGAAHFGLQWDVVGPAYGRVQLGLRSGLPGLNL